MELNSCHEEASKNFTVISNTPNFSLKWVHITQFYSDISTESSKGKPGSDWEKIVSLDSLWIWFNREYISSVSLPENNCRATVIL